MTPTWICSRSRLGGLGLSLVLLACLGSCRGTRNKMDPTLEVRTRGGQELGVSTEFGVLFLGRTARSGEVQLTAWFGDGPSTETSVIEPLGDGLYTAETQIRLPSTPMTFQMPQPGDRLILVGRSGSDVWEERVTVRSDERVEGLLLDVPGRLRNAPDQVGAGLFTEIERGRTKHRYLVALVSGRLALDDANGGRRVYLTAVGPDHIWRLVTRRQDLLNRKRWVYREDIL